MLDDRVFAAANVAHADCFSRYNTFFVLYPIGISSECWLMYKAIDPAESWNKAYGYVIKAILFIYIPGEQQSIA